MMKRVMVMDTEKWRLVMDKLTTLLTKGCWSMKISSSVDMQDRPRKLTDNIQMKTTITLYTSSLPSQPAIL